MGSEMCIRDRVKRSNRWRNRAIMAESSYQQDHSNRGRPSNRRSNVRIERENEENNAENS